MKKRFLILLTAIIFIVPVFRLATFASDGISVYLDGTKLTFDQSPQIVKGRTVVPMRAIFEVLGATVKWDDNTKIVAAQAGPAVIALTVGSNTAYINGSETPLDAPAFIKDGRTFVPLRFVAESTGASVEWDNDARSVIITTAIHENEASPSPEPTATAQPTSTAVPDATPSPTITASPSPEPAPTIAPDTQADDQDPIPKPDDDPGTAIPDDDLY